MTRANGVVLPHFNGENTQNNIVTNADYLILKNVYKSFGGKTVFKDLSLGFRKGSVTCILGPSGCGKTTLLNIIGGLESPDAGCLEGFEGMGCSYVFQEPRLLPWKTVLQNIVFVMPGNEAAALNLLERVRLAALAHRYPAQLSGGERQRVALARAFAFPSQIILMDEPLTGLDMALKQEMMTWFREVWRADAATGSPRTVLYVTHDPEEAAALGQEIIHLG